MSELAVSFGIGATLGASVKAVTGDTVRHLDRVRKATTATERASAQIAGYRALRTSLGAATAALRTSERRAEELRRALQSTTRPTADLRRRFVAARAETERLSTAVSRQRRELIGQARGLREAGVQVRQLDREEERLTNTLREQIAYRDRLAKAVDARSAARSRRESARGDIVEAGALAYAVLRPMQAVVGKAVEFEEKMADIGKVVEFPAPGGLQAMGKDLRALSTRIPLAASGFADIVAEAGQAGIARGELLRFAEDSAKVAVAFDLTGKQAGDAMAGLRTIFTLGQDEVMDLAGAYNFLSNNMAARAPDLLNVANRAGGMAKIVGLSGQQLGALGATMLALKTPPEVAGTAINAMLTKLSTVGSEGPKVQAALEEIGLSASAVQAAMGHDAETAIVSVLEAVSKSDDVVGTLKALFGAEYADDVAKIVASMDEYAKARRLAASEEARATSVEKEYEARAATTANALTLLRGKVDDLAINIGSALLPGINAMLEPLGAAIQAASSLAAQFPRVTAAVVALTAGLIVGKVVVVAYRYASASLGETLRAVQARYVRLVPVVASAWQWLTATTFALARVPAAGAAASAGVGRVARSFRILRLALVSTGIGAVVVGLGLAVAWLIRHWAGVKAFFGGIARGASEALAPLKGIGDAIGSVIGWIGSLFAPVEQSQESLEKWASAGEVVGTAIKVLVRGLVAMVSPLAIVGNLLGAAWSAATGDWEAAARRFGNAGEWLARSPIGLLGQAVGLIDDPDASATAPTPSGSATAPVGAATPAAAQLPATPQPGAPPLDIGLPTEFPSPISPGSPLPATTSSGSRVDVQARIVVNPPAGADQHAIAREVQRQLAEQTRRAVVEAGLGEDDG